MKHIQILECQPLFRDSLPKFFTTFFSIANVFNPIEGAIKLLLRFSFGVEPGKRRQNRQDRAGDKKVSFHFKPESAIHFDGVALPMVTALEGKRYFRGLEINNRVG